MTFQQSSTRIHLARLMTLMEDLILDVSQVAHALGTVGTIRWRARALVGSTRTLETENENFLLEKEEPEKRGDSKVTDLESEINVLREEIESLRIELGVEDKTSGASPTLNREKQRK